MQNFIFEFCLLSAVYSLKCLGLLVKTPSGYLESSNTKLMNGKLIHSFFGIPYAVPPVSELRFKEPQPFGSWTGVWNSTTYPRICIQYNNFMQIVIGEEDCLYLNIFTPKLPDEKWHYGNSMDVVVWFHGGSFIQGTGNYLTPEYLLAYHDVVFVSVNYRLGLFGFFSTDDEIVPGNNGLKDQALALQWVQTNIKAFGGNQNSVTIAGSSAGASSVHFHILSPMSKGLFQKAIMHSGTSFQPWLLMGNVPEVSKQFAQLLGCPLNTSKEMVDCLRQRPAFAITSLHPQTMVWRHLGRQFGPVIEPAGKDRFLDDHPAALLRKLNSQIPCLMGVVADEGLIGFHTFIDNRVILRELDNKFDELAPYLMYYYQRLPEEKQHQLTQKIRHNFFQNDSLITEENYKKFVKVLGDRLIRAYVEYAIREYVVANIGSVYYFQFNYRGQYSTTNKYTHNLKSFGVSHGDDMLYILRPDNHFVVTREDDIKVSKLMTNIWASFLKNGKPELHVDWPSISNDPWETGYIFLKISAANDTHIDTHKDISAFQFWNESLNEFPAIKLLDLRDEL